LGRVILPEGREVNNRSLGRVEEVEEVSTECGNRWLLVKSFMAEEKRRRDMQTRHTTLILTVFLTLAVSALLVLSGCRGGERGAERVSEDGVSGDSGGRVIIPDADWEPADGEDEEVSEDEEESEADGEEDSSTEVVIEADTIEITLFVDGALHPLDEPIFMHEGEQAECEFRLRATGSELARYSIDSAARVSVPKVGELSGYVARVTYQFTFVSRLWGEGGIMIMVANRRGSAEFRQIPVVPAPLPGFGSD